jgi:hypothetical protein
MGRPYTRRVRPRLLAAAVLVAVAASLIAFQPLRSPWWSGYDYDSVYVATGLTLFRGDRSNFYDHPGTPLQEGLAAIFTGAWLVSGDDRKAKADAWIADLDTTRPYLRVFGSLLYIVSALIALFTVAWITRSAWWGFLGGLLFLASPDLITWAAVVKPDPLLAGLAVACVGLLVEAARRRSGPLYLAAGFVLGFDLSVKVQAVGLALPLVIAALLRPPPAGWWTTFRGQARAWLAAHRRLVVVVGGVWLALVVFFNALSAPPEAKPVAELVAGIAALAALAVIAWWIFRGTRLAGLVSVAIGCSFAVVAGMVVPNLFYASMPAPTVRQAAITLTGGGVNSGAHPAQPVWATLTSWHVLLLVAVVGLVRALSTRELATALWACAALAFGLLAYLRFGEIHYYTAAIALATPLVIRAAQSLRVAPIILSVLLVAACIYRPYRTEIDKARSRTDDAEMTQRVNAWVDPRLHGNDVALTELEANDARIFHLVHFYSPWAQEPDYRFLPADHDAARWIRDHDKRVVYVITSSPEDATYALRSIGLNGQATRVASAPGFVYRVSE